MRQCLDNDRIDEKFGFERVSDLKERIGFMINMHVVRKMVGLLIQSEIISTFSDRNPGR